MHYSTRDQRYYWGGNLNKELSRIEKEQALAAAIDAKRFCFLGSASTAARNATQQRSA